MKKNIISVLIFINTFFLGNSVTQINHQLIRISPEIGDTINLSERNYYNLFPVIKDFQYAVFYLINDTTSELKIWYLNERGSAADTLLTNTAESIGNFRVYIRQIDQDRLNNFESDFVIKLTKLDGTQFVGKLLSVQENSIILCPDSLSPAYTLSFLRTYTRLTSNEVGSVQLEFDSWSRTESGMRIGVLLGGISGFIISLTTKSTTNNTEQGWGISEEGVNLWGGVIYTVLGGLIGGALGAGVGYLTSPADETIEINSASDLEKLKKYVVQ